MAKGYWITCYRSVTDEATLANYATVAGPAIEAHGGRFLARGNPVKTYEAGLSQRLVIIESESVKKAIEMRARGVPGCFGNVGCLRRARPAHHQCG